MDYYFNNMSAVSATLNCNHIRERVHLAFNFNVVFHSVVADTISDNVFVIPISFGFLSRKEKSLLELHSKVGLDSI